MDFKEEKALMEKLGKAWYDSLDDAGRKRIDDGKAADARLAAIYAQDEDAEHAWTCYLMSLSEPERDALCEDSAKYMAVSGLFRWNASDPEKRKLYANMTVDELAQIVADEDAATLAEMDDATFAKTVADLKIAAPGRLAAALASLKNTARDIKRTQKTALALTCGECKGRSIIWGLAGIVLPLLTDPLMTVRLSVTEQG